MSRSSWKTTTTCLRPVRIAPFRYGLSVAGLLVLAAASSGPVGANPQGAQVVAGNVTLQETAPGTLQVQQGSNAAIVNWQSFDIDAGETTQFVMPSSDSVNLSRVVGGNLSQIYGTLEGNGTLYLVNPQGVVFGQGANVNVGSLVATTADIADEDFLNGRLSFNRASPNANASVINAGTITVAERGLAALVAPEVENSGVIEARLGQVVLGGAQTFAIDLHGDGMLSFAVGEPVQASPADGGALVENSGTIRADGGRVLLTAEAAAGVVDNVIDMSGIVEARTVGVDDAGVITLYGGDDGLVQVSGTLDASGEGVGQSGGRVEVLGELVDLQDGAAIDASGSAGGGTVLVGGDYQGGGDTPTSRRTLVEQGAEIAADAIDNGDGGTVVVWGDEAAVLNGRISATGGAAGGDGGLVELSSFGGIGAATAEVDVGALNGEAGTWLIDPENITIEAQTSPPGGTQSDVLFNDAPDDLEIDPTVIEATTGTLVLQARGDISIDSGFIADADVVMQAGDSIFVNASIGLGDSTTDLHLEALSPHAPAPVIDDGGVIEFGVGGGISFVGGGTLTMIASDFTGVSLDDAISVDEIGATRTSLTFLRDAGITVGGTDSDLTAEEIFTVDDDTTGLSEETDQLIIGQASTAGTDGLGADAIDVAVAQIDLVGNVVFDDDSRLSFISGGDFDSNGFDIASVGTSSEPLAHLDITADKSINFSAGTDVTVDGDVALFAIEDINLETTAAGSIAISGESIALDATNDIVLDAPGNIALIAGGAPTPAANGDIFVVAAGDFTASSGNETTLDAGSNITIAAALANLELAATNALTLDAGQSIGVTAINEGSVRLLVPGRLLLMADEDVIAQELAIGGDFLAGNLFFFAGTNELAIQAGRNVTLSGEFSGGAIFLEADSPEATNGGDGDGALTLDEDIDIGAEGGGADLTLIGADFAFDPGAVIAVGTGNVLIAPSTPTQLTLGGAASTLSATELSQIQSTGEWSLGAANTALAADVDQSEVTASSIQLQGDLNLPNIAALQLVATGAIGNTVGVEEFNLFTNNLSVRAGGDVALSGGVSLLEISAPGQDVAFTNFTDLTVGDVALSLGVPSGNIAGITAQNLTLEAIGSLTFAVAHNVPGTHVVSSEASTTVTFQSPITGNGRLIVDSFGPANFNSTVDGLSLLWVDADSDVTFAGDVGSGSRLGSVVIGELPTVGEEINLAAVNAVAGQLSAGQIAAASANVPNGGDDVSIGGRFVAGNLLLKPEGTSTSVDGALDVGRLLVSGTAATLFGEVQNVAGPLAAFLARSEAPSDGVPSFDPNAFTLNGCVIGTFCGLDGDGTVGLPPPDIDVPPWLEPLPPTVARPTLIIDDVLVAQEPRLVPELDGRFSNSGNEEIW